VDTRGHLFGELFLAQLVEHEELPGECDVVDEAAAGQLHTDNDLSVWNDHRN